MAGIGRGRWHRPSFNNTAAFQELQNRGPTTLDLLDGDALESSLVRLQAVRRRTPSTRTLFTQAHLDELVGVTKLDDFDQASFDKLDGWLKARLQALRRGQARSRARQSDPAGDLPLHQTRPHLLRPDAEGAEPQVRVQLRRHASSRTRPGRRCSISRSTAPGRRPSTR